MTTNAERVTLAETAYLAYRRAINSDCELVDLFTDLLHLAQSYTQDPIAVAAQAMQHYQEERCKSQSS